MSRQIPDGRGPRPRVCDFPKLSLWGQGIYFCHEGERDMQNPELYRETAPNMVTFSGGDGIGTVFYLDPMY